jgi:hypothetical protein
VIKFRIAKHHVLEGLEVVEVLIDGNTCAVIYPAGPEGLRLISAHMTDVTHSDGRDQEVPLPEVTILFRPEPYTIQFGTIIRGRRA